MTSRIPISNRGEIGLRIAEAAADCGIACVAADPGDGILSENADPARRRAEAGLTFIGPCLKAPELFGDKRRARAPAAGSGVAVAGGTIGGDFDLPTAQDFRDASPDGEAMILKAVAGGDGPVDGAGGRGRWRRATIPMPRGHVILPRVNAERIDDTGAALVACGTLSVFEPPPASRSRCSRR